MLERFKTPGKDARLVRCKKEIYKIEMKYGGIDDRSPRRMPCSEDTMHKEIELVLRALIHALETKAFQKKVQTQHFIIDCSMKKWDLVSKYKIDFRQYGKDLTPFPYTLVLHIKGKESSAVSQKSDATNSKVYQKHASSVSPAHESQIRPLSSPIEDLLSAADVIRKEVHMTRDNIYSSESSGDTSSRKSDDYNNRSKGRKRARKSPVKNSIGQPKGRRGLRSGKSLVDESSLNETTTSKKFSVARKSVRVMYDTSESEEETASFVPRQSEPEANVDNQDKGSSPDLLASRTVKTRFYAKSPTADKPTVSSGRKRPKRITRSTVTDTANSEGDRLNKLSKPHDKFLLRTPEKSQAAPSPKKKRITPSRYRGGSIATGVLKSARKIFPTRP